MKKTLLLITFLVFSMAGFTQQTVESSLKNAKKYLSNDPCNSTGIVWAKSALKLEPGNKEALELIDGCDNIEMAESKAVLKENPNDFSATRTLEKLLKKQPNDEEMNYLVANSYLQDSPSHIVQKYISKAIKANPGNLDYRWIRVRCKMMSYSNLDDYELAVQDLNFMITNGAKSAKIYAYLSAAEREMGDAWRYKAVSQNNGWKDDNGKQVSEKKQNETKALEHYKKAKEAADIAVKMKQSYAHKLRISSIDNSIAELSK